jgi:hypothetical protein
MKNVLICKKCGDDLGLKYEGSIELSDVYRDIFWDEINKIDELITKLNSCRSIISICAERLLEDESGALWAAYDIMKDIESKLDENVSGLKEIYAETKQTTKKAKKK